MGDRQSLFRRFVLQLHLVARTTILPVTVVMLILMVVFDWPPAATSTGDVDTRRLALTMTFVVVLAWVGGNWIGHKAEGFIQAARQGSPTSAARRRNRERGEQNRLTARAMRAEGASVHRIATTLGITERQVYRLLNSDPSVEETATLRR